MPLRETTPTWPRLKTLPGMMPTRHSSGVITPGQFGPMRVRPLPRSVRFTVIMSSVGMPSVMQMITLICESAASRMASAAPGAGTKISEQSIGPALLDGLGDGVEDRHAEGRLAAAAGRAAGDDLRAVLDAALGLEAALASGDALDEDARVLC